MLVFFNFFKILLFQTTSLRKNRYSYLSLNMHFRKRNCAIIKQKYVGICPRLFHFTKLIPKDFLFPFYSIRIFNLSKKGNKYSLKNNARCIDFLKKFTKKSGVSLCLATSLYLYTSQLGMPF